MLAWLVKLEDPIPGDPNYRPFRTGMLADALVAHGHAVVRWASGFDHYNRRRRAEGDAIVEAGERFEIRLLDAGREYRRAVSAARLLSSARVVRRYRRAAQRMPRPDVIVCSMPTPALAWASAGLARRFGTPLVLDCRDLWPDVLNEVARRADADEAGSPLAAAARRVGLRMVAWHMARQLRFAARTAAGLVGINDAFLAHLLRYAGRDQGPLDAVFPLGFPEGRAFAEDAVCKAAADWRRELGIGDGDDAFVVCFAGRLNAVVEEAFAHVVQAARAARSRVPELRVVVCGIGDREDAVRRLAASEPAIRFAGQVDALRLEALRSIAAAGLIPTARRHDYQQSLSNKFFEYISSGLPVLCHLDGLAGRTLREHGCGIVYDDGGQLADAIVSLATSSEMRQRMARAARGLFEDRFAAGRIYEAYVAYLERVARSQRSSGHGPGDRGP
ncbi:MAG: glycosyltransferase [Phycisphaerales bacterium]|nr:glycosyltransferase [Phycisphaerales bacterium]